MMLCSFLRSGCERIEQEWQEEQLTDQLFVFGVAILPFYDDEVVFLTV